MPGEAAQTWDPALEDMEPAGHMEAPYAAIWAYGVNLALPLLFVGIVLGGALRLRARARAARAVEMAGAAPPLAGQTVIRGEVVEVEGAEAAIRVSIAQRGSEHKGKEGWTTTWLETGREVETHPFYVETAGQSRIRVEPGPSVTLVDELDGGEPAGPSMRVRRAELSIRESVFVLGELVHGADPRARAGYRGAERALVMRPDSRGHMLVSSQGLAAPLAQQAGKRLRWVAIVLIAMAGAHLLAIRYHLAFALGTTEAAVVLDRSQKIVKTSDGDRADSVVRYRVTSSGAVITQEVEVEDYPHLTEGRIIPVTTSPWMTTNGAGATEQGVLLFFPSACLMALLIGGTIAVVRARPWYDRKRLNESNEGRLAGGVASASAGGAG